MKIRTIRLIDRYIGIPLCFLLTLLDRLIRPVRNRPCSPPRKMLFLKLIEQGATVLAAPALRHACTIAGRENVYFCVFVENRPIIDLLDIVPAGNVFAVRSDNMLVFLVDTARMLIAARRAGIDTVVDMEFFSRASASLAYLTGAVRRVGFHRFTSELPYRGDLMTHRIIYNPCLHMARTYLLLVKAVQADHGAFPPIPFTDDELAVMPERYRPAVETIRRVHDMLDAAVEGTPGWPLIVINPNSTDMLPLRRWDVACFSRLIGVILQHHPRATIVITGTSAERGPAESLRAGHGCRNIVNLAGMTTLEELVALYCIADVHVTNDSGPGHFASLTDIGNIVLFGPETPKLFGPLNNAHILYRKLACSPCITVLNNRFSPCASNKCMQDIGVDEVYQAIGICIAKGRQRTASSSTPRSR